MASDSAAQLATEARWQVAAESAGISLWDFNLVTGELFLSEMWYRLRGLEPRVSNHIAETEWLDRIHQDDRAFVADILARQNRGEVEKISHEHRERHENGHYIWILSRGRVIVDNSGKPLRFIGTNTDITEVKSVSQQARMLANSEQRYRTAMDGAHQGLWDIDETSGQSFFSRHWFTMRGLDPRDKQASTNEAWLARIHPEDLPTVQACIKADHQGKTNVINIEYRERHADGSYIWIMSRGSTLHRKADGTPGRQIGTDTNITAIKETEMRLRDMADSERRWRIAVESAGQGLWDINHATNENYFSDSWRTMRGISKEGIEPPTSGDWLQTVHPDDRQRLIAEFDKRKENRGDVVEHEYRQRHANGKWVWVLSRGKIVERDGDGNTVRLIGTDTDITAIKETETRLNDLGDSEQRWRIAVESAGQGVWDVNHATGETYHSNNWRKIRGLGPDDPLPDGFEGWLSRVHPDDHAVIKERIRIQDENQTDIVSYEYRERHSAGHWVWVLCSGRIIARDARGMPERTIGTDTDITAIKDAHAKAMELTHVEQRWRTAVESARQAIWDIDDATGARYHSPTWFEIRGLPATNASAASYESWIKRVHPQDLDRVTSQIEEEDAGRTNVINVEYRERHADGHYIWILSRGNIVQRGKDKKPTRTIGTDTDITALKQSEELNRQLAERHELAVSSSKIGVWEYDLINLRPIWDKNTRELFGVVVPNDQLPPDFWEQSIHPDDREKTVRIAEDAVANFGGYAMDYRIITPAGVVKHIRCRARYYKVQDADPKLIGVSWDVTADYENAAALKRAKELAERRNEELEIARRKMEYNSYHDALTGLPNRRHLDSKLQSINRGEKPSRPSRTAVFHVDLDRFKQINDTLGHAAGDMVLHHVSDILRDSFNAGATVFRAGGDEFVVVIDNARDDAQLSSIAKTLVKKMRQPVDFDGHECHYGASIGIAVSEDGTIDGRQLLINADIALYRAKNEGRNRYCFFTQEMQTQIISQKRTADDILRGLDRNEFFPVYQLQFCAVTHDVLGVEALVRWRHPEKGVITPDAFLPVAEDINAVARLDELVLTRSLEDLAMWRNQGLDIPHVSVNVSARRLGDERLIERISRLDIPKNSLSFELLESIYLDDQSNTIARNLAEIRKLGIGIEIDDFGTGHASISCLLSLRPERFKIDKELIKPILASVGQRRLVASIVDIGRSLNIQVVAEGVETLDHARILRDLDCDVLQGYAFARPMDATAISDFVGNARWRKAA